MLVFIGLYKLALKVAGEKWFSPGESKISTWNLDPLYLQI